MHVPPRDWRTYPWHVVIPMTLYVLLTVAGVSQSSIGVAALREDPSSPHGLTLGTPREIRSDEFLTSAPTSLGVTATGNPEDNNPLSGPQRMLSGLPSGVLSSLVLLDGTALQLGPVFPDEILFAARWWLPFLVLALAAPAFFRRLTGSRYIGYFAATLIVLSPASAWWSFSPVQVLGWSMAGAVVMLRAVESLRQRRTVATAAWVVLAALLLARTLYTYQPWAIMLVPTVVLTAAATAVFTPGQRRQALIVVSATGMSALVFVATLLWENWQEIAVLSSTVYPGDRRSSGAPNPLQELFGATNLGVLTHDVTLTNTNASEISSSFAVAFVWVALLLAHGVRYRHTGQRAAVYVALALSGWWLAWSTVSFGTLGARLPLANIVPSPRAADFVGFIGVILLCLVLPRAAPRNSLGFAVMAALSVGAVAAYAGSLLKAQNIAALPVRDVWISSVLLAITVLIITWRPRQRVGYALGGLLALALVWNVNPAQVGLADLRDSEVATTMLRDGAEARSSGNYWVADEYTVDSLLMATGVPSLSGRQIAGPNEVEWLRLDPQREHEEVWNRGGAFIWFSWTDDAELSWSNPSPDVIRITGSPCTLAERMPDLARVVSSQELKLGCLSGPADRFEWAGSQRWVYDVRP